MGRAWKLLIRGARAFFRHPLVQLQESDSPETTLHRARIIREKGFLYRLYIRWYGLLADRIPEEVAGAVLELGSGPGFLKEIIPEAITSDTLLLPSVDAVFDGTCFPFREKRLKAILMIDVFHHLPDVRSFFRESSRCITTDGRILMIEPWMTVFSRRVYRYLHFEPVDMKAKSWRLSGRGPLTRANSALPWIVFQRDLARFEKEFPEWELSDVFLHTPFSYLISGGVSFKGILPKSWFQPIVRLETILTPWMSIWAMFAIIELRRRA